MHEIFINIINSQNSSIELVAEAVQGLNNMTSDNYNRDRDFFTVRLAERLMELIDLTANIETEPHKSCHEFSIRALYNSFKPPDLLREIGPIPILRKMLHYVNQPLDYQNLSIIKTDHLQLALKAVNVTTNYELAEYFIPFLRDNFAFVRKIVSLIDTIPSLAPELCRIVGNLVSTENEELSIIILSETDYLDKINNIIRNSNDKVLVCDVCYDISNITGGTVMKHIEMVVYNEIFSELIALAKTGAPKIRKEAGWAVIHTTKHLDISLLEKLIELGIIELLCELMAAQELGLYLGCLQAFAWLLRKMETVVDNQIIIYNPVAIKIGDCGGIETISAAHLNTQATNLQTKIMEKYFGNSYEEFLARRRGLKLKKAVR